MFVRHQLLSLRYGTLIEDACQITSELVGNAVEAIERTSPHDRRVRGAIRLRLGPQGGRMLLEVWDSVPEPPVLREPDLLAESGRGLHIVRSLAAQFGWFPDQDKGGKTVWAVLG
jgi:anti-sigma regulatory factor (Ser/Thr protein kinase)